MADPRGQKPHRSWPRYLRMRGPRHRAGAADMRLTVELGPLSKVSPARVPPTDSLSALALVLLISVSIGKEAHGVGATLESGVARLMQLSGPRVLGWSAGSGHGRAGNSPGRILTTATWLAPPTNSYVRLTLWFCPRVAMSKLAGKTYVKPLSSFIVLACPFTSEITPLTSAAAATLTAAESAMVATGMTNFPHLFAPDYIA